MNKLKLLSLSVSFVVLTIFFGIIWSRNPSFLPFLNLSEKTWLKLYEFTGWNKLDVEILVSLFFGAQLAVVVILVLNGIYLAFKWLTMRSSGR